MTFARIGVLTVVVLFFVNLTTIHGVRGAEKDNRLFEMRTYVTYPGKLEALHKRFREHTNVLFEKHGMQLVGYWTPVDGAEAENTLVYILVYPDRSARDQAFSEIPSARSDCSTARTRGRMSSRICACVGM